MVGYVPEMTACFAMLLCWRVLWYQYEWEGCCVVVVVVVCCAGVAEDAVALWILPWMQRNDMTAL